MVYNISRFSVLALVGVALSGTLIGPAHGQNGQNGQNGQEGQGGPQGNGQGGPRRGFDGQNGPGGNFQGRGGPGGFGGQMPMAMGTITGGDASAGTIVINSQFGNSQTIKVTANTTFSTQTTVTVADLKVNDVIRVQGIPTGITASFITAGTIPDFLNGGNNGFRGQGGPGGLGGPGGPGGPNNQNGQSNAVTPSVAERQAGAGGQGANSRQNGTNPQASASAQGKVVSLSPLTIVINDEVTVILKLASKAKVTRITSTKFSNLKIGDRIVAGGQTGTDGTFTATGVGINMEMGGMGSPGGLGGFGGPGGPGGGPGGFGGPGGPGGPGGQGGPGGGPGGPPPSGE